MSNTKANKTEQKETQPSQQEEEIELPEGFSKDNEVQAVNQFVKINEENPTFTGIFLGIEKRIFKKSEGEKEVPIALNSEGEEVILPSNYILVSKLRNAQENDLIHIIYDGKERNNSGGETKFFKVFIKTKELTPRK